MKEKEEAEEIKSKKMGKKVRRNGTEEESYSYRRGFISSATLSLVNKN